MSRIICHIPLIPMRSEPSHRAEMVSQLLFGEKAVILNESGDWLQIRTEFDSYMGWLESKSIEFFDEKTDTSDWLINRYPILHIRKKDKEMHIPGGAEFPKPDLNGFFEINNCKYQVQPGISNQVHDLISIAQNYINAPYLWGGKSLMGIDCSGFIQLIHKIKGIALPRDAKDQCKIGISIASLEEAKTGDLLYFDNEAGKITHVGMFISPGKIIHASGSVRIDRIDHKGIFNETSGKYTHSLKTINRLI